MIIKTIQNRIRRLKLWQKLLALYLILSVIPIIVLTCFAYSSSIRLMHTQVTGRLSAITASTGAQIDENLELTDLVCQPIIYNDDFLKHLYTRNGSVGSVQALHNQMQEIKRQLDPTFDYSVHVALVFPDNETVSADNSASFLSFEPAKKAFPKEGTRFVNCTQTKITIVYRIINAYEGSEPIAFLTVTADPDAFLGSKSLQTTDEYIFIIQDSGGKTLYMDAHTQRNFGQTVINKLNQSNNNIVRIHNESYLYEPLAIDSTDWNLCMLVPRSMLYEGFASFTFGALTIGVLCLVVVGIFSVISSLSISRRINNISSEMVLIGEGQLDLKTDIDPANDEIGQLSVLFNRMMERINSLIIEQYKNEIKSKEEQLQILQNQINPHFLYNCMDTINWRSILNNDEKTSAFANNLADFYRTCLNKGNTKIRMHDEFRNIRAYVYLQMDMHDNSFDYEENIDPELYDYQGINLMLQPIVENALEHGLEPMQGQRGKIQLTAKFLDTPAEKQIQIDVFNSGKPIDRETAAAVTEGKKGYGLSNVNNRIRLFFGNEYGIRIVATDSGTVCTIIIPARRWDEE